MYIFQDLPRNFFNILNYYKIFLFFLNLFLHKDIWHSRTVCLEHPMCYTAESDFNKLPQIWTLILYKLTETVLNICVKIYRYFWLAAELNSFLVPFSVKFDLIKYSKASLRLFIFIYLSSVSFSIWDAWNSVACGTKLKTNNCEYALLGNF